MLKKNLWVGLAVGFALGLAVSSVLGQSAEEEHAQQIIQNFFRPLAWAVTQVDNYYVEEPDYRKLLEGAYQGMLSRLDRYSLYFPPDAYKEFKDDTRGEFGGLGIEISYDMVKKAVVVEHPIPGTPAFEKGLMSGDLIVAALEKSTGQTTRMEDLQDVHDALKVLRGKAGDEVVLTVVRAGSGKVEEIAITRATIAVPGVRGTQMIDPENKIGYIYVADFHERLSADLEAEISKLLKEGMRGLILDLRFNKGGLLDSSVRVANLFLSDKTVVSTRGRNLPTELYIARKAEVYPDLPLVVLVNRMSASAAEIVAAALKDHKRALLVGETTFGKGSVQTVIENPRDHSAIKLTTARYFTPEGLQIEGQGVKPDVELKLSDEDLRKLAAHLSEMIRYPARPKPEAAASEPKAAEEQKHEFRDEQLARAVAEMIQMLNQRAKPQAQTAAAAAAGT